MHLRLRAAFAVMIIFLVKGPTLVMADGEGHSHGPGAASAEPHHPVNWRFTMPRGNAAKGREVFQKYECSYCHTIEGEKFPHPIDYGPELSQMAPLHPLEFFAESIINPNAVVAMEERGLDGRSPMSQDHLDKMTLREFIDVTTYIASLKPPAPAKTVSGVGKVIAITPTTGEVVLDHENLKGFMEAMTMGYKVSASKLLQGLKPGDKVSFIIDTERRVITMIQKIKN